MSSAHSAGLPYMRAFARPRSLLGFPSIMYEARVYGAPANPTSAARPSSSRRTIRSASKISGVASSASTTRSARTAASSRTGSWMIGPMPGSIENGTPMP